MSASRIKTQFRYIGASALLVIFLSIWLFGKPMQYSLSDEAKTEIERIAKSICGAANEQNCQVVWSGKHRWFGSLVPAPSGQAVAGVVHIRHALAAPTWVERRGSNGVTFADGRHEVFASAESGVITITTIEQARK